MVCAPGVCCEDTQCTALGNGTNTCTNGQCSCVGRCLTEFPLPTADAKPSSIVLGPDGNMWFTEANAHKIGRITPAGVITEFPVTTTAQSIGPIVAVGGVLWFAESNSGELGMITTEGVISHVTQMDPTLVQGISADAAGNIWHTGFNNTVVRVVPGGAQTAFTLPTPNAAPKWIAPGPDNTMWALENNASKAARIAADGAITEYPLTDNAGPQAMALGPDGNFWITFGNGLGMGKLTPQGVYSVVNLPFDQSYGAGIVLGDDNALWYGAGIGNSVIRLAVDGTTTVFPVPTPSARLSGFAKGADGSIWFTEEDGNKIGHLSN